MTREENIAAIRPKLLEAILKAFADTYNGDIKEDTLLDQGWDSLDLIEIVMAIEDTLDVDIYDDFIDSVIKDHNEIEKLTPGTLADLFLAETHDQHLVNVVAHLASPKDRLQIDLLPK